MGLDLVQNLAALYIMCDIDQMLVLPDSALIDKLKNEIERI